jgi:DNA gyrase/topoisomerase IV subunit B
MSRVLYLVNNTQQALAAWHNEHRIRLRNEKTRVRFLPEYKVFRETEKTRDAIKSRFFEILRLN